MNYSNKISDSLVSESYSIYNYQKINYNTRIFKKSIVIKKGDLYRNELVKQSYKRLISLGLFKYVNISFDTINNNKLIGNIILNPATTQNLSFSLDGTNNERLFGFQNSLDYLHNNLFHGGERLSLSVKSSLEIQLLLTDSKESGFTNKPNTIEFGPHFHFYLPKYFLINKIGNLKKHINPTTEISGTFNIQDRPDFRRVNQELSFGWIFHEKKPITWHINPILISIIDIELTEKFKSQIEDLNDQYISASFQDHVVAGGVFSFEYNNQKFKYNSRAFYFKSTLELAGGSLFRIHELINKEKDLVTNSYNFLGIRYAHYQKITFDIRYYQPFSKNHHQKECLPQLQDYNNYQPDN